MHSIIRIDEVERRGTAKITPADCESQGAPVSGLYPTGARLGRPRLRQPLLNMTAMRFALLGSGSKGNALVVEQGATRLLIDCGFSAREIEKRLARLELAPADIDAIVITHEHDDHWKGVSRFSRAHDAARVAHAGHAGRQVVAARSPPPSCIRRMSRSPSAIWNCFPIRCHTMRANPRSS